ncbi:HAD family hydrolase [Kitasatospora sp. GAS1066B]|uniref:HAD family hydrolase n=1 Tax=Kitasatospora sp. GAS1066B TaxID=3156271 RepID=UPI0035149EB5
MTHSTGTTIAPIRIVWDWNGTLRDDLDDHVAALNATLPALGAAPVSRETYQAEHRVPIPRFYEALLGRPITEDEWKASDAAFLDVLARRPVRLRSGARQLMLRLRARGLGQSLLSLAPHEVLVKEVAQVGIGGLLERVDGRTSSSGGTKGMALAAHLEALGPHVDPSRVLVIGDSLDDAAAARAVGAFPVLYSGGLHSAERLTVAGVPLVDTLEDAVATGIAALAHQQLTAA